MAIIIPVCVSKQYILLVGKPALVPLSLEFSDKFRKMLGSVMGALLS